MTEETNQDHETFADTFGPNLWKVAVIFLGLIVFVLFVEFLLHSITKVQLATPHTYISSNMLTTISEHLLIHALFY